MKFFKYLLVGFLVLFISIIILVVGFIFYAIKCPVEHKMLSWNNVYNTYPKGSSIDSIFLYIPDNNRFFVTDDYIITIFDLYKRRGSEATAKHLMFYDKNLELKHSCFFPIPIDSIKNNTIYTVFDSLVYQRYEARKADYICDLPLNYSVQINKHSRSISDNYTSFRLVDVDMNNFPTIELITDKRTMEFPIECISILPESDIYIKRPGGDHGDWRKYRIYIDENRMSYYYILLRKEFDKWSVK